MQRARHGGGVILPRQHRPAVGMKQQLAGLLVLRLRIVVGQHDDVLAAELLGVFIAPLAGAADVGGGDQPFVVSRSTSFSPSAIHTVASPEARRPGSR